MLSVLLLMRSHKPPKQEPPCTSQLCMALCFTAWKNNSGTSFRFEKDGTVRVLGRKNPNWPDEYYWYLTGSDLRVRVPDEEAVDFTGSVEINDGGLVISGGLSVCFGGSSRLVQDDTQ